MSIKLPAAWFPLALVGLSGLGLGLFIGMPLGLGDAASLRGQLAKKAAENAALDGERNKLQGTIADLTAALDAAKLPPRDKKGLKSSSPAGADWKPAQEFARSYGPCSGFARFAQHSKGRRRGTLHPIGLQGGTICLVCGRRQSGCNCMIPRRRITSVSCRSVFHRTPHRTDWGELTVARLEIDLGKAWELKATGDDYVGSLQRACEAVGRAIGFDDREIQRMRKVARLVVPVPPKDALNGMAAVAERIPPKPRQRFSKKVDVVLQLVAQRDPAGKLFSLAGGESQPAINFVLSKRYVASIRFGDYSGSELPSLWSISITPNTSFGRDEAWCQVDGNDLDGMASGD